MVADLSMFRAPLALFLAELFAAISEKVASVRHGANDVGALTRWADFSEIAVDLLGHREVVAGRINRDRAFKCARE